MSKYDLSEFTYDEKIDILFELSEDERNLIECRWHFHIDDDYIIGNAFVHMGYGAGVAFNHKYVAISTWDIENPIKKYEILGLITLESKKEYCKKFIDNVLYEYFEYKYEQQLKQLKHDNILHNIRKAII